MKVFHLLLILCLIFTLNCKDSKAIFRCVLNKSSDAALAFFVNTFKLSKNMAYGLLDSNKKNVIELINSCK